MSPRSSTPPPSATQRLNVAGLPRRAPRSFRLSTDPAARARLAETLDLLALRKLAFDGTLTPDGHDDWRLDAMLGATVVQACVVSGNPVTTRIDTRVLRHFVADMAEPEGSEAESPDDDTREALGAVIDLGAVMAEALSLALPDYPRAPDLPAEPTAPEQVSLDDEVRPNPFAALAALKPRSNTRDGGNGTD